MEYSREQKANIFDVVNSNHLHLTGEKRKATRRQFLSWKQNKTIGAYDLFIKLYEAEDVFEKRVDFFKKYIEDEGPFWQGQIDKKPVSNERYRLYMAYKNEEIEGLEKKLEDVEECNGYVSKEYHDEEMKKQLDEQQQLIRENGHIISKLRNESTFLREKYEAIEKTLQAQKLYFEDQINKINIK
tara:strand:- start:366 stop:920 length:555 start_codon:yes stop_codon:yes gene_type:complete